MSKRDVYSDSAADRMDQFGPLKLELHGERWPSTVDRVAWVVGHPHGVARDLIASRDEEAAIMIIDDLIAAMSCALRAVGGGMVLTDEMMESAAPVVAENLEMGSVLLRSWEVA